MSFDLVLKSYEIIEEAYRRFSSLALAWTGGKDSTLILWLVRNWTSQHNLPLPKIVFIDEGDVFPEVLEFVAYVAGLWDLKVNMTRNEDVMSQVKEYGDTIIVSGLNERNRAELERLGFEEDSFMFEPESFVGNHLMKTVALNMWLEDNQVSGLITGIRLDEQGARSNEIYFSERDNPRHTRIHPILHYTEREVWDQILSAGIPYCPLYAEGYRSLGAKTTTTKPSSIPAWRQDLVNTTERIGRRQDKESLMGQLRALGYM